MTSQNGHCRVQLKILLVGSQHHSTFTQTTSSSLSRDSDFPQAVRAFHP